MKIDKLTIQSSIESATNFEQIQVLFHSDCKWECEESGILSSVNKAIDLVTTFEQGRLLAEKLSICGNPWYRLLEKMTGLAVTEDDLLLFLEDYFETGSLEARNILRKVFDRADELGLEARP